MPFNFYGKTTFIDVRTWIFRRPRPQKYHPRPHLSNNRHPRMVGICSVMN